MLTIDQKRKIMHPVGHIDAVVQHHGKHQTVRLGHADGEERALRLLTVKVPVFQEVFLDLSSDPFLAKGVDP